MKAVLYILLIILNYSVIFSQTPSPCNPQIEEIIPCPNIGCDNPYSQWLEGHSYIYLPDFPNCELFVKFCYRICNTNPVTEQIFIYEVTITYPGAACQPCCGALMSYYSTPLGMKKYFLKVWEELTRKRYEDFANNTINKPNLYCPNNKVEYTATQGSCVAFCERQVDYYEGGIAKTKLVVSQIPCTEDGCCFYQREYCLDPNTEEIVIGPTTLDTYGEITDCAGRQFPEAYPVECYQGTNTIFEECEEDCVDPSEL